MIARWMRSLVCRPGSSDATAWRQPTAKVHRCRSRKFVVPGPTNALVGRVFAATGARPGCARPAVRRDGCAASSRSDEKQAFDAGEPGRGAPGLAARGCAHDRPRPARHGESFAALANVLRGEAALAMAITRIGAQCAMLPGAARPPITASSMIEAMIDAMRCTGQPHQRFR
jgi:hypothetical protein